MARHAGVPASDVGFSGLKDRRAVTRQWFSVLRHQSDIDWAACAPDGVRLVDVQRHTRKLRRGTHTGNHFRIALRHGDIASEEEALVDRLGRIAEAGVPNYFGPQRFGNNASNLELATDLFAGRRLRRDKRSIAISAARSFLFNEILSKRVAANNWNHIIVGELANLDGSNSVFAVPCPDETIERRCMEMDIHPSGPLYGKVGKAPSADVALIEQAVLDEHRDLAEGLVTIGVEASRRSLRLRVHDLSWCFEDGVLWLEFGLPKGGFATAVLDEIAVCQSPRSNT